MPFFGLFWLSLSQKHWKYVVKFSQALRQSIQRKQPHQNWTKKNSAYLPNISKYTSNYQFNHRKVAKRTTSWTQNVRELSAPFIQG